ncbi:MAG: type II toxin-antitoxin system HicA family toxin [Chloroflexi bacterium]|nr:type II toxin-antitoxin system HicA family toxin [Chloroflexota bacterium]
MPPLPVLSGDAFVKAMERIGYRWVHTRGSHMILAHTSGQRLSVPRHRELDRGLLRRLIRDADLTVQQLLDLVK